ncbi:DNA-3-methyladenine glycosylase I [soil metagenome]
MDIAVGLDGRPKCGWCAGDQLYEDYHDNEWGVPMRDDRELFGLLMLEGFQAGLAWITILRKREHFARVFDNWNPDLVANYGPEKVEALLSDPGIVRNRLKVQGAVKNALAWQEVQHEHGSFGHYLWSFVGGEQQIIRPVSKADYRSTSPDSDAMSKDLKKRGFAFVGSTICYAFMQSAGMVDDHMAGCWRISD